MGKGDKTRSLELVARCVEFFKGGWGVFDAGFFEYVRVDPQPVHAVNVHRHRHVITFVLHRIRDFFVE